MQIYSRFKRILLERLQSIYFIKTLFYLKKIELIDVFI